ncbi:MAG: PAS domain-containing protein, partial [Gallionella sp.]
MQNDVNLSGVQQKSLYRELTIGLVVLVSLVSVAVSLFNYVYSTREADALLDSKVSAYTANLRESLEWPLWNIDDELIGKIGRAIATNEEIASLTVRDDQQRLVYSHQNSNGNQLKREFVIEHNGQNIGRVEIGLSLHVYEAKNKWLLFNSIVTAALLIVSLLGALRWMLSRLLKKPVDALVGVIGEVVEGKYRQIDLTESYVEFASILSSFKIMKDAVASREYSLNQTNEQLAAEIDERRRAEEALRVNEERLKLATSAGNIGIWDCDVVKNRLTWDESMYSLYGIRKEEFSGAYDAWIGTLHPDDRQFTDGEIQAALQGEREYAPEFRIVRPDGIVRNIKAASKTYFDPQGKPFRMIGINVDITERKQAEFVLRQSEEALKEAQRIAHLGSWHLDIATNQVVWSEELYKLYGFDPALPPPLYTESMKLFTPESWERLSTSIAQVTETGIPYELELETVQKDGGRGWMLARGELVRDAHGAAVRVRGVVMDITGRKQVEDELRKYKDHLEEEVQERTADLVLARNAAEAANRAKSVFLSSMSHELRTPLNAILGFSNMMRKDPLLQQGQRESLDIINRSGEHLLTLINDVLEMAKIEAGRVQLDIAPFDLGGLVRDVTDMMNVRAREKGLQLLIDQSSEFPRYIKGDEARVRQVLINLVGNAVKFTRQGGITVRFGMKPNAVPPRLLIEVEDSGIGIDVADQQKIFEPFVQLGKTAAQKGTGLGLTITRQFVQLMGGVLSLESKQGVGSIFRVELPADRVDAIEVSRAESVGRGDITGMVPGQPDYRILIVEDQLENQLLLRKLMENIGLQTRIAENGEQALALFQSWQPHLIWMDRRMPVMDGIEATRRIRGLSGGSDVKIVAVTASAFTEQRDEMLAAGMDDFVRKPYRFNEIYECLSKQLGVHYTYADAQAVDEVMDVVLTGEMLSI